MVHAVATVDAAMDGSAVLRREAAGTRELVGLLRSTGMVTSSADGSDKSAPGSSTPAAVAHGAGRAAATGSVRWRAGGDTGELGMRQVETLWPVASTLKGNGRFSGHVRGPLDDLREEVEQLLSFGEGQPAECRNLDLPDPGEDLVRRGRACWGDLHEEASPVVGIRLADDPPAALEQIGDRVL